MNVLVIAAHPDDEVLGMGGTIRKLSKDGNKVRLCVVTEGATAQYNDKKMILERKNACLKSSKILGISEVDFLEFPDMSLDTIPHLEINKSLEKIIKSFKPFIVYTTPENTLNKDHTLVYESTLVATRSTSTKIKKIFSYEIPGPTKDPFKPNYYENIKKELDLKIKAMKCYKSEIEKFPHPRSIEMINVNSLNRGMEAGLPAAEAFQAIKIISD
tara:strand:- start:198 stop:842 length:645 start_codon:yes stop_codon:yes gene_type:complete